MKRAFRGMFGVFWRMAGAVTLVAMFFGLCGCEVLSEHAGVIGNEFGNVLGGLIGTFEEDVGEQRPLEEVLVEACEDEVAVDIEKYGITAKELEQVFLGLYYAGAMPWYTQDTYGYVYNPKSGLVSEFSPRTLYDGELDKELYENEVEKVLETCVLEGMDEYQVALALHDYLVVHACYDGTLTKHSGYDLLVEGTAVCDGYASAYQDLLKRVGIDSVVVISEKMEHAWNLVEIDGEWYHVDLTWDDPTPDVVGRVEHGCFLLSDVEIMSGERPHYGWDRQVACNDGRFKEAYWKGVYSPICFVDSETCFLVRMQEQPLNCIYRRDENSGEETLLYSEESKGIDIGHGAYLYGHYGLSLLNERLYFGLMDSVWSMEMDGNDVREVYGYDIGKEGRYIAGCAVIDGELWVSVTGHEQKKVERVGATELLK